MKKQTIDATMIIWVALILAVALGAWAIRPMFHGAIMLAYIHPVGAMLAVGAVISLFLMEAWKEDEEIGALVATVSAALFLLALAVYVAVAPGMSRKAAYEHYRYGETKDLPVMREARVLPLRVAERFGRDAHQDPTEAPHIYQPQLWDDRWRYSAALTPDGSVRKLTKKAQGLILVDANSSTRQVEFVRQEFAVSDGVVISDNIRWRIWADHRFFVNLPEVVYAKHQSKPVALVPVVAYRGFPFRYPVFDGFYLVDAEGGMEWVLPKEAPNHLAAKFAGRVFPEAVARYMVEAYAYKRGLLNHRLFHEDQIEISDPSGEPNKQPYLLDTAEGLRWITAADPFGESHGVSKIFVTDALTGRTEILSIDRDSALTGPSQAIGYVKSAFPMFDWHGGSGNSSSGNIKAIEPRPVVVADTLYWMVSITTTESKGVERTCFVDSKTSKVISFVHDEEAKAFIRGEQLPEIQPESSTAGGDRKEELEALRSLLREALERLEKLDE